MNKKIIIIIGTLVAGIVLILGFSLFNPKSKEVIVINSENDFEAAIGKNVFIRAELYASKLPILKFGDTPIYCWEKYRASICHTPAEFHGLEMGSEQSIKVKVWGKLGKHQSEPFDQFIHGNYEIESYRMEVDNE